MDWERVRLARGVWRPAKHIFDRERGETPRKATGTVALPGHSEAAIWRDKACSFKDSSINGEICTAHGGRFFWNTKPL